MAKGKGPWLKNRSIADMKDRSNLRRDMHKKAKKFLKMKHKAIQRRLKRLADRSQANPDSAENEK